MRWRVLSLCLVLVALCLTCGREAISEAKAHGVPSRQLGSASASVSGVVTYVDTGECYLEPANRSGGIYVQGDTTGIALGTGAEAHGVYSVVGGEPAVVAATIMPAAGLGAVRSLAMGNRSIAGAASQSFPAVCDFVYGNAPDSAWRPAGGAKNTGLLVTTWGTVRAVYQVGGFTGTSMMRWIYVDDGSAVISDCGDTGVLVYTTADVSEGDFVSVTGISSVEPSIDDSSRLIRVIRTRAAGDVSVVRPKPALTTPFSDEFDKPKLDPRWGLFIGGWALRFNSAVGGSFSLEETPGWATLVPPASSGYTNGTQLVQYAPGKWNAEIKVRFIAEEVANTRCGFTAALWSSSQPLASAGIVGLFSMRYDSTTQPAFQGVALGDSSNAIPLDQEAYWFRVRWGGNQPAYVSYSTDGSSYSPEVPASASNSPWQPYYQPFVVLYTYSSTLSNACTARIDYIHFRPYTALPEE